MNKQNDSRSRGRVRGTCLSQSVQQTSTGQPATDVMKGSDRKGEKERERERVGQTGYLWYTSDKSSRMSSDMCRAKLFAQIQPNASKPTQ